MNCRFCGDKHRGRKSQCVPWDPWFHHRHLTYLGTDEWQAKRAAVMAERGAKCEQCGWAFDLEVHHLNYCRLGVERMSDLMVLCSDCHEKTHTLQDQKRKSAKAVTVIVVEPKDSRKEPPSPKPKPKTTASQMTLIAGRTDNR